MERKDIGAVHFINERWTDGTSHPQEGGLVISVCPQGIRLSAYALDDGDADLILPPRACSEAILLLQQALSEHENLSPADPPERDR